MKKALLFLCAASLILSMCGCSKTIELNTQFTTKSETTPAPQTEQTATPASEPTQTTLPETTVASTPETSANGTTTASRTDKPQTAEPSSAEKPTTAIGTIVKYQVTDLTLSYDDGVYVNLNSGEYDEDGDELYLTHYSDDGEVTSTIAIACSEEDDDTANKSLEEIIDELIGYYTVEDTVDSYKKGATKIGNTDAFYVRIKASSDSLTESSTQYIYIARYGNKIYLVIAVHLDNNETYVTKSLNDILKSMTFDKSVNA